MFAEPRRKTGLSVYRRFFMPDAQLYFLSDQYYIDFPDDKLMKNKDTIDGIAHSRPCFLAFPDAKNPAIYWLVPISSRYEKYQKIAQAKSKNMAAATPSASAPCWAGMPPSSSKICALSPHPT